jgi:hypothetical protein
MARSKIIMSSAVKQEKVEFDVLAAFTHLRETFGSDSYESVPMQELWKVVERMEALVTNGFISPECADVILMREPIKFVEDLIVLMEAYENEDRHLSCLIADQLTGGDNEWWAVEEVLGVIERQKESRRFV